MHIERCNLEHARFSALIYTLFLSLDKPLAFPPHRQKFHILRRRKASESSSPTCRTHCPRNRVLPLHSSLIRTSVSTAETALQQKWGLLVHACPVTWFCWVFLNHGHKNMHHKEKSTEGRERRRKLLLYLLLGYKRGYFDSATYCSAVFSSSTRSCSCVFAALAVCQPFFRLKWRERYVPITCSQTPWKMW